MPHRGVTCACRCTACHGGCHSTWRAFTCRCDAWEMANLSLIHPVILPHCSCLKQQRVRRGKGAFTGLAPPTKPEVRPPAKSYDFKPNIPKPTHGEKMKCPAPRCRAVFPSIKIGTEKCPECGRGWAWGWEPVPPRKPEVARALFTQEAIGAAVYFDKKVAGL